MSDRCAKLPRAVIPVLWKSCRGMEASGPSAGDGSDISASLVAAALHANL